METNQQNKLTMLQTVVLFFEDLGKKLAAIKRIGAGRDALAKVVGKLETAAGAQDAPTTGVTRDREAVKKEAAAKAEALRQFVLGVSTDATVRAKLQTAVSRHLHEKDAELLRYFQTIAESIGTLPADDLDPAETGYDAKLLKTLTGDIALLTDTRGAARQIELGTETATADIETLLAEADAVLANTLDRLVKAQKLALPTEVAEYEKARRIVHTATRRRPRYAGTVAAGAAALVYDRRTAGRPDPTLTNRSGRGRTLRYYTAATATAQPAAGQGVMVKNRTEVHLTDYAKLGPDPDAPFLLVVLEGVDGEGHWGVK